MSEIQNSGFKGRFFSSIIVGLILFVMLLIYVYRYNLNFLPA